ncbi:ABC transporter substrate-binding protein [Rathayibacter soli]|uniref:ABC transporter substrate-binding protein n=1 Tax=Rathayibacter soli TaxID=3144168 RepID=UPI0027E57ABC|nr:sugar ABC transporter substrate-binding protein [Glaciibacter superstes]
MNLAFSAWEFEEPGKGDAIWNALKDYHGPQNNITVQRVGIPYANYADKIATEVGAKGGPDVFVLQDSQFSTFADAGLLVPLDDIAKEYKGTLNHTNDFGKIKGKYYGLAWEQSDYALMYNKDLMAKAGISIPTTYPELVAAAKEVHEKLGIWGYANRSNINELDGWTLEINNWISGFGGALSQNGKLTINSPKNIAAIKAYVDLFRSGAVPVGDSSSTLRQAFALNQVGFVIENAGVASTLTQDPKNLINGMNLGVAPLPFPHPGGHTAIILAVNKYSSHVSEAKDFVRYVLSEKAQKGLRTALTDTTLATDVPLEPAFVKANPFATEFMELGKHSTDSVVAGYAKNSRAIYNVFLTAVQGLVTNGGDVKAALTGVQNQVVNQFG